MFSHHPDMSDHAEEDMTHNDIGAKKRRKSTVSKVKNCAECRRLKLRCDRQIPCNNCLRRKTGSICPEGALKTTKGRRLILDGQEALHERIACLERSLAERGDHPLLANAFHLDPHESPSASEGEDLATERHVSPKGPRGGVERRISQQLPTASAGPNTGLQSEELTEASMDNAKTGEDGPPHGHLQVDSGDLSTSRFFGDASSLFLAERQPSMADRPLARTDGPYSFRSGWVESFMFSQDTALRFEYTLDALVAQLPPGEEAERLLRSYFECVSWGSAIVDRNTFAAEFFYPFYSAHRLDSQHLAVLFFVLALGSLFDPSAPPGANNNAQSRDLFALGRACLAIDASGSIIFVQAVHLMVTWLNNGGRPVSSNQSTWPLIGMAMRVVQALGLHRDGKHFDLPPAEIAKRRRVFWEVYAYDINHSVTSARPRSMTSGTYDVEFPTTEEGGEYYHEMRYRLSQLFCRINDEQSAIASTPYETIIDIDRELRQFQQQLPAQLATGDVPPLPSSPPVHHIQRHTMRFRCNLGFLVLHRKWFARAFVEDPEEPLRSKYSPSFVGCLEACKLIISVVRRLSDDAPFIAQRRWFFLFNAFTACACLAATVIRAPRSMLAQSSLESLEEGVKLFEEAGKHDELIVLYRLQDTARRNFSQSDRTIPTTDEDLALLGKRSHKRTSSTSVSPASAGPSVSPLAMTIGAVQANGQSSRPLVGNSLRNLDLGGAAPALQNKQAAVDGHERLGVMTRHNTHSEFGTSAPNTAAPGPLLNNLNSYEGGTTTVEFDFDAFFTSFGFSNTGDISGVQGDMGEGYGMLGTTNWYQPGD
ncbi:fungal-specific transcription factor domain-domain-containing protein [Naematelia encephala]|uniref:Fungal-specific transcription factor domain-domain-containing protein n=1 Tax=Naematelia encephala TaxID=71784 RepID=A0A1Y2ASC2_9TREE|nr:fungal-specific transcription factor domain-domain-containing protein [Naematelia encephala]